jgi:hypothetical protein
MALRFSASWSDPFTVAVADGAVDEDRYGAPRAYGLRRTRLPRYPFHGGQERKPSGIPVAMVFDHGAVISTGFPSSDAGWGPTAPGGRRYDRMPSAWNVAPKNKK